MEPHNISQPNFLSEPASVSGELFLYGALLVVILFSSSLLNAFTFLVFLKNKVLRSNNNLLVVTLAVCDWLHVLVGCGVPFLWFTAGGHFDLNKSARLCAVVGYITHNLYAASTNTLVLISIHRLLSIAYPQKKIMATVNSAKRALAVLGIYTCLSCVPAMTRPNSYKYNSHIKTCTLLTNEEAGRVIVLYSSLVNFLIPLLVMSVVYMKIYHTVLRHKTSIVSLTKKMSGVIEQKSKRLILTVLGIFVVTWVPFYLVMLFSAWGGMEVPSMIMALVWPLKMSSCVSNPIIYAVCNRLYCHCMIRMVKCKGPMRELHRMAFSLTSDQPPVSNANKLDVSTIAPLPPDPMTCQHCIYCKRYIAASNMEHVPFEHSGTQTSAVYKNSKAGGMRPSVCSRCTDRAASTLSSIPTVYRMSFSQRQNRSASSKSFSSTRACGPTPDQDMSSDSGRSSFASHYGIPQAIAYGKSPYSSNFPVSQRSSLVREFSPGRSSPTGSVASLDKEEIGNHRISWGSSRWSSFRSSQSMPFSARSSFASSSLSHVHQLSTRSSLTSQYTYGATPFSTRSNSPGNGDSPMYNPDEEVFFVPRESTFKSPSRFQSEVQEKASILHRVNRHFDIFEDEENVNSTGSDDLFNRMTTPQARSMASSRGEHSGCSEAEQLDAMSQRICMFLLGDMDFEEVCERVDFNKKKNRKKPGYHSSKEHVVRQHECSTESASYCVDEFVAESPGVQRPKSCSWAPSTENERKTRKAPVCRTPIIRSVGEAASTLVCANKLRGRIHPMVAQDSQVDLPASPTCHVVQMYQPHAQPRVREPKRFVYEPPIPNNYYPYSPSSKMNTLRVPGRAQFINVPTTILEEEVIEPFAPPPSPCTMRRKNASPWLEPPVIDLGQGDNEGMRVECPGVLVEHHI